MSSDIRPVSIAANSFNDVLASVSYAGEGPLTSAGAALSSFFASYGNKTDHEVKILQGYASMAAQNGTTVSSPITGAMNDDSGNRATVVVCVAFPAQLS
jgi:hypothetical protein